MKKYMDWQKNISVNWCLCDYLNVEQAAALIAGFDPNFTFFHDSSIHFENYEGITDNTGASDVQASFEALKGAINAKVLEAEVITRESSLDYFETTSKLSPIPDWKKTTIKVEHLKDWLQNKKIYPSFFFSGKTIVNLSCTQSEDPDSQAEIPKGAINLTQQFVIAEKEIERLKQELAAALAQVDELQSLLGFNDQTAEDSIKTTSDRRARQIRFIIATAKALEYDPLAIPDGGKAEIWKVCAKLSSLFSESSFSHAWKAATGNNWIRMVNHAKFASR